MRKDELRCGRESFDLGEFSGLQGRVHSSKAVGLWGLQSHHWVNFDLNISQAPLTRDKGNHQMLSVELLRPDK